MMRHTPMIAAVLFVAAAVASAPAAGQPKALPTRPAATQPAGIVTDWSKSDFVHPPLKVMEPYRRIDAFPVMAWCFHGKHTTGRYGFNEDYARDAKQAGFNALIDGPRMLAPCRKVGGIKVLVVAFWGNQQKIIAEDFKNYGDPSSLIGFVLDDNCMSISRAVIQVSTQLKKTHPHLAPFVSENPTPQAQSKTPVRILGTQNYPFLRGFRGHWRRRKAYCQGLDLDRRCGNAWNMSFWPLFGGHKNTASQHRFQVLSALAYGAQGVIHFAYTPHRGGIWHPPENPFRKAAADVNNYAWQVAGRHLWGTRCAGVYHRPDEGDSPKGHLVPGADQPVVKLGEQLMAGVLMVEKKFLAKTAKGQKKVPDYVMVVDKRTSRVAQQPPERDAWLALGPDIPVVEVLDRDAAKKGAVRKFQPGCHVTLNLRGGDGLLLRANPPDLAEAVGGAQIAHLYVEIAGRAGAAYRARDMAALKKAVDGPVARLEKLVGAAVKAGKISAAQAGETLERLTGAIKALREQAKAPPAKGEAKPPKSK